MDLFVSNESSLYKMMVDVFGVLLAELTLKSGANLMMFCG